MLYDRLDICLCIALLFLESEINKKNILHIIADYIEKELWYIVTIINYYILALGGGGMGNDSKLVE